VSPKGKPPEQSVSLPAEPDLLHSIEIAEAGLPNANSLAQPDSLAGFFVVNLPQYAELPSPSYQIEGGQTVELRELPDGTFELWAGGIYTDKPEALARISLEGGAPLSTVLELRQAADGSKRVAWRDESWRGSGFTPDAFDFLLDGKLYYLKVPDDGPAMLIDAATREEHSPSPEEVQDILSRGIVNSFDGILERLIPGGEGEQEAETTPTSADYEGYGDRNLISLQRIDNGCWWMSGWHEKPTSAPAELEAMRARLMEAAAERHGLSYHSGDISGAQSLKQATDLLSDPKFNHGIENVEFFQLCARPQG